MAMAMSDRKLKLKARWMKVELRGRKHACRMHPE